MERQLIRDYEGLIQSLLKDLNPDNHALAVELASLAQRVRGFGPVKLQALEQVRQREGELLHQFKQSAVSASD